MASLLLFSFVLVLHPSFYPKTASLYDTTLSCSNQTLNAHNNSQFAAAVETLLLQLRSQLKFSTRRGFSSGEINYGSKSKVFATLQCVKRDVSLKCEDCIAKGIEKLYEQCSGKGGGISVTRYCMVRYEGFEFSGTCDEHGYDFRSNNGSRNGSRYEEGNEDEGVVQFKVKVVLLWGVGVAFFSVFVFCAWVMRRSILNTSKIGSYGGEEDDKIGRDVNL